MRQGYKRSLRNLKSQAALEFLTTYGWAFLVILIMISALAYFGILRPSRLLPDRCTFGPEMECQDFQISKTANTIKVRLKNNVGEPVNINSITASTESATALSCTTSPTVSGVWSPGEVKDLTWSGCNSDAVGFVITDKSKAIIRVSYYEVKSGSAYAHDVNGEIFGTVV